MCVVSIEKEPYIANENIVVYKLISLKRGFMYTPILDCLLREYPKYKVNPITHNLTRV